MCAVIERHASGQPHAHVLLNGKALHPSEAVRIAGTLGLGRVHLQRHTVKRARQDYLLKQARWDDTRAMHLEDNGRRLIATSWPITNRGSACNLRSRRSLRRR